VVVLLSLLIARVFAESFLALAAWRGRGGFVFARRPERLTELHFDWTMDVGYEI
jgi:hypothetical protein